MDEKFEDLCKRTFNPYGKEIDFLFDELRDALKDENKQQASEYADRIYVLLLDTSLRYARFASNLEQRIKKERTKLKKEEIDSYQEIINRAKISYSAINNTLKDFQEYQQERGLTNAPDE